MAFGGSKPDPQCAAFPSPESSEVRDVSASYILAATMQQFLNQFEKHLLSRAGGWTPMHELKFRFTTENLSNMVTKRVALLALFWECPSCGHRPGREFLVETGWFTQEQFAGEDPAIQVPRTMPEAVMDVAASLVLRHGRDDTARWLQESQYAAKYAKPENGPESVDDLPEEFRLRQDPES